MAQPCAYYHVKIVLVAQEQQFLHTKKPVCLKKAWLILSLRRWRIQDKPNILVTLYMAIILVGKRNVNISISHLLDISLSGSGYCSKRRSLVYLPTPK